MTLPEAPVPLRAIRFLEEWACDGWRLKVYGIRYGGTRPDPRLVARAKAVAKDALPSPAVTEGRYGVGFMGVHQGQGADLIFVDWWADENELHHRVWHSAPAVRGELIPARSESLTACVWDLRVIGFERDAWVENVLRRRLGPDVEAYLATRLDEEA